MPKKISIEKQRQWLEWYESGMSEAKIAKKSKSGLNTVKRNLELARAERVSHGVQIELYRDALQKHQKQLLDLVVSIDRVIEVPSIEISIPSTGDRVFIDGVTVHYQAEKVSSVEIESEKDPAYELLREHLKLDTLWSVIDNWKKALAAHLQDRLSLKKCAMDVINANTNISISSVKMSPPYIYENITVDMFYKDSIRNVLGRTLLHDYQSEIQGNGIGQILCGKGIVMAEVSPAQEANLVKQLLLSFSDLKKLPENDQVAMSYRLLEEATTKAKATIQEIILLGMIPGKCRICRRLGIK